MYCKYFISLSYQYIQCYISMFFLMPQGYELFRIVREATESVDNGEVAIVLKHNRLHQHDAALIRSQYFVYSS